MNIDSKDMSIILNNDKKFLQNTYGKNFTQNKDESSLRLVTAIVIDIYNDVINQSGGDKYPPFSIRVIVPSRDYDSNLTDPYSIPPTVIPPLFPPYNFALPEIGEEVLILYSGTKINYGRWMTKRWYGNRLNKRLAGSDINSNLNVEKTGFNFDINDIAIETYESVSSSISIPIKHGDVIQQGRANTFIRHSYNPQDPLKTGVLEMGIKTPNTIYTTNTEDPKPSIGITKTKTIHFHTDTIQNIFNINDTILKLNKKDETSTEKIPHIVNVSHKFVNVSPIGENELFSQVLGERQNFFNLQITNIVDKIEGSLTSLQVAINSLQSSLTGLSNDIKEGSAIETQIEKNSISFEDGKGNDQSFEYVSNVKVKLNFNIDSISDLEPFKEIENNLELLKAQINSELYLSKVNKIN